MSGPARAFQSNGPKPSAQQTSRFHYDGPGPESSREPRKPEPDTHRTHTKRLIQSPQDGPGVIALGPDGTRAHTILDGPSPAAFCLA